MADMQTLEQRFEDISVQDENDDINAPAAERKAKVLRIARRLKLEQTVSKTLHSGFLKHRSFSV